MELLYKHGTVNGILSDYYAMALTSCVACEGKWEERAERTNLLTSLMVNQSFKCELIWGPKSASGVFDCRLLLCLGPVYVWKLGFINVEEFGVTCAAVLRVTLCWCSTPTRVLNLYCLDISCRLRAGLIILSYLP